MYTYKEYLIVCVFCFCLFVTVRVNDIGALLPLLYSCVCECVCVFFFSFFSGFLLYNMLVYFCCCVVLVWLTPRQTGRAQVQEVRVERQKKGGVVKDENNSAG